jgi:hypothetical protein
MPQLVTDCTDVFSTAARPVISFITEGRCEEPELLRVDSDRIVVLRCVAEGIPPPTVRWMFQDRVLVSGCGQYFGVYV